MNALRQMPLTSRSGNLSYALWHPSQWLEIKVRDNYNG